MTGALMRVIPPGGRRWEQLSLHELAQHPTGIYLWHDHYHSASERRVRVVAPAQRAVMRPSPLLLAREVYLRGWVYDLELNGRPLPSAPWACAYTLGLGDPDEFMIVIRDDDEIPV